MKSTGIVRRIDELGRLTLPKETRDMLGFGERESIEIFLEEDKICLMKYVPDKGCKQCGSTENVIIVEGSRICSHCLEKFNTAIKNAR